VVHASPAVWNAHLNRELDWAIDILSVHGSRVALITMPDINAADEAPDIAAPWVSTSPSVAVTRESSVVVVPAAMWEIESNSVGNGRRAAAESPGQPGSLGSPPSLRRACAGGLKDQTHRGCPAGARRSIHATEPAEITSSTDGFTGDPYSGFAPGTGKIVAIHRGSPSVSQFVNSEHQALSN
jgi:hypothetical protein